MSSSKPGPLNLGAVPKPFRLCRRKPKRCIRPWKSTLKNVSKWNLQVHSHKVVPVVLCLRRSGFCITNGITSHAEENVSNVNCALLRQLSKMTISKLFVTDEASYCRWVLFKQSLHSDHHLGRLAVANMKVNAGNCPTCHENCVRWTAVQAMSMFQTLKIKDIPHGESLKVKSQQRKQSLVEDEI